MYRLASYVRFSLNPFLDKDESGFNAMLTGHEDLQQAGRAILEIGPRIVVQTEGVDGSYTVSADEEFHTPAFEVDVIDTTGAGYVFTEAYKRSY
jgi:sugar/nucleoside kinase (ribokinase family)